MKVTRLALGCPEAVGRGPSEIASLSIAHWTKPRGGPRRLRRQRSPGAASRDAVAVRPPGDVPGQVLRGRPSYQRPEEAPTRRRRSAARTGGLCPRISRFEQFLRDFLLDDNEALRRPHRVFDSTVLVTRPHNEMRRLASDLLVFLQRDLDMVCTASIVAFTKELEIPRRLLDVSAVEAERSLLDALVHLTEERFVCGEPGGVQDSMLLLGPRL